MVVNRSGSRPLMRSKGTAQLRGLRTGRVAERVLHDQTGYIPSAAPVVSWSDSGGSTGTIVVKRSASPRRPSTGCGCRERCHGC